MTARVLLVCCALVACRTPEQPQPVQREPFATPSDVPARADKPASAQDAGFPNPAPQSPDAGPPAPGDAGLYIHVVEGSPDPARGVAAAGRLP